MSRQSQQKRLASKKHKPAQAAPRTGPSTCRLRSLPNHSSHECFDCIPSRTEADGRRLLEQTLALFDGGLAFEGTFHLGRPAWQRCTGSDPAVGTALELFATCFAAGPRDPPSTLDAFAMIIGNRSRLDVTDTCDKGCLTMAADSRYCGTRERPSSLVELGWTWLAPDWSWQCRASVWVRLERPGSAAGGAPAATGRERQATDSLRVTSSQPLTPERIPESPILEAVVVFLTAYCDSVYAGEPELGVAPVYPHLEHDWMERDRRSRDVAADLEATRASVLAAGSERDRALRMLSTEQLTSDALRADVDRRCAEIRRLKAMPAGPSPAELRRAEDECRQLRLSVVDMQQQRDCALLKAQQRSDEAGVLRGIVYRLEQAAAHRCPLPGAQGPILADADAHTAAAANDAQAVPDSFDELAAWAERVLGDRVVVTPGALSAACKSVYDDPPRAYRALLVLAECYWPMLYSPGGGDHKAFTARLEALHLECSHVGSCFRSGRERKAYEAYIDGTHHLLDMHLKANNSFDPRHLLRIYFTRDDAHRRIVVGHLPGHLPVAKSN